MRAPLRIQLVGLLLAICVAFSTAFAVDDDLHHQVRSLISRSLKEKGVKRRAAGRFKQKRKTSALTYTIAGHDDDESKSTKTSYFTKAPKASKAPKGVLRKGLHSKAPKGTKAPVESRAPKATKPEKMYKSSDKVVTSSFQVTNDFGAFCGDGLDGTFTEMNEAQFDSILQDVGKGLVDVNPVLVGVESYSYDFTPAPCCAAGVCTAESNGSILIVDYVFACMLECPAELNGFDDDFSR